MRRIIERVVTVVTTTTWTISWQNDSIQSNLQPAPVTESDSSDETAKHIQKFSSVTTTKEDDSAETKTETDSTADEPQNPSYFDQSRKGEFLMPSLQEQNKGLVHSFNQAFNAGDLDGAVAAFAPNAVIHNSGTPDPLNVEGFKQFGGVFRTAFPDGKLTIEDLIVDGDKVVSRISYRGTHTGDMMGIPPTGKSVTVSAMIIDQFADGKIVESWRLFDQIGMMQQLDLIPA